jgi:hypothetical protein
MDPQLAMIMANVASVRKDSLVLDPFAGTGWRFLGISILHLYLWQVAFFWAPLILAHYA